MNASLAFRGSMFHAGRRLLWVHVNLTNPLGGLDELMHRNTNLRGWGTQPLPDPVLLYVRGFDPSTNHFLYTVNPRFGNTNPSQTTLRAPFQLTLDVSVALGRYVAEQQLERYLKPGRSGQPGPRLTVAELKTRYERNVTDPYAAILSESDSLLLAPPQAAALQKVRERYRQRMDSLWTALSEYLDGLGDKYDVAIAVARQEGAIADARELTRLDVQLEIPRILTPIQIKLLPSNALAYYNAKTPIKGSGRTLTP